MQKAVRGRSTNVSEMLSQRQQQGSQTRDDDEPSQNYQGINYCPISTPEENIRNEVDNLLQEYTALTNRINFITNRLSQLGFQPHQ
jgi:hypothetical protein